MPPLRLVFKNLFKHKVRAVLTIASLAIALFLLCLLQSLVTAITAGVKAAAANRLIVQSTVSLFVGLPKAYEAKLRTVDHGLELSASFEARTRHQYLRSVVSEIVRRVAVIPRSQIRFALEKLDVVSTWIS